MDGAFGSNLQQKGAKSLALSIIHLKKRCSGEWFGTLFFWDLSQFEKLSEIKPSLMLFGFSILSFKSFLSSQKFTNSIWLFLSLHVISNVIKVKGHLFSQCQIDGLLRYMAPKQFSETTFIIKTRWSWFLRISTFVY